MYKKFYYKVIHITIVEIFLIIIFPLILFAATSGNLWFRPEVNPGQTFAINNTTGTPFNITIISSVLGGSLHIEVFDPCDELIQLNDLVFSGADTSIVNINASRIGAYFIKIDGVGRYKFQTDQSQFVLPGGADFDAWYDWSNGPVEGTYYFLVPSECFSFDLRLKARDAGESASIEVKDPLSSLILNTSLSNQEIIYTIQVSSTQAGKLWSIYINHIGDVEFQLLGIPNWFADSSDSLFLPAVSEPCSIPAIIDIHPDTLNLKSKGKWMTCYIELTDEYTDSVIDIDVDTVTLTVDSCNTDNCTVSRALEAPINIGDYDNDAIPDLMVKFDREGVQTMASSGPVEIIIGGSLIDGTTFEGRDTVLVIDKGNVHTNETNHGSVEY